VADVLRDHVALEYEAIDRMYLNVYVPHLQTVGAMVGYLRVHRGQRFASTTAVAPMTEAFVRNIEQFVAAEGIDLIAFDGIGRRSSVAEGTTAVSLVTGGKRGPQQALGRCKCSGLQVALLVMPTEGFGPHRPSMSG
jgi:hypothetical protein